MRIAVMTADKHIISLDVDPDESVENVKALLEVEMRAPLQQQQLLFNDREMRNNEKLSSLRVKEEDLVMMVSNATSRSFKEMEASYESETIEEYQGDGVNYEMEIFEDD